MQPLRPAVGLRYFGSAICSAARTSGSVTLAAPHTSVLEVKKSKFIATAGPAETAQQALQLLESAREPDASHNCWAYRVGAAYRCSDDGEPSGTAGRPILSAIEGGGLDGVAVMVVRYYGGIKLGAGGLTRAYGQAARQCLRDAPKKDMIPMVQLAMQVPFDLLGAVHSALSQAGVEQRQEEYQDDAVTMTVEVPAAISEGLCEAISNSTRGKVTASVT